MQPFLQNITHDLHVEILSRLSHLDDSQFIENTWEGLVPFARWYLTLTEFSNNNTNTHFPVSLNYVIAGQMTFLFLSAKMQVLLSTSMHQGQLLSHSQGESCLPWQLLIESGEKRPWSHVVMLPSERTEATTPVKTILTARIDHWLVSRIGRNQYELH